MSRIDIDAAVVRRQIESLRAEYPEVFGDDEDALLALESETDLTELATRLVKMVREEDADISGIDGYVAELQARKARKARKAEAGRSMLLALLESSGVQKLPLPIATLSVGRKPVSVIVCDEAALPDQFFRIKREPNKTAIKSAIEDGADVPGAHLSNGGTRLIVGGK